jgi:hypothetical protein
MLSSRESISCGSPVSQIELIECAALQGSAGTLNVEILNERDVRYGRAKAALGPDICQLGSETQLLKMAFEKLSQRRLSGRTSCAGRQANRCSDGDQPIAAG